jgi:hypothetical protein
MVNHAIFDRALTPLEIQQLFQHGKVQTLANYPWLNQTVAMDSNDDGSVHPFDLLLVVNRLIEDGIGPLPTPSVGNEPPPFADVSASGSLEPFDALLIINWLTKYPDGGGGGGAATSAVAPLAVAPAANSADDVSAGSLTQPLGSLPSDPTAKSLAGPMASTVVAGPTGVFVLSTSAPALTDPTSGSTPVLPVQSNEAPSSSPTRDKPAELLIEPDAPRASIWRDDESGSTQADEAADDACAVDRFFAELGV